MRLPSIKASKTTQAAAQASGLPPNVEPWSPAWKALATLSVAMKAPIGTPPARPFASVTISGFTPNC